MRERPDASLLIAAVAAFLRDDALPRLDGRVAFHARVAANALDIVRRELETAPAAETAEHERLRALLGRDGTLDALNRELCARIADGSMTLVAPGLADHLWAVALAKLAVDQPTYSGYLKALQGDDLGF
jgi:hypothetical protein